MEFKRAKSSNHLDKQAESALAQIDRLWYQAELEQHKTDRIIKIGLAFAGKRVAMAYTDG
ncbi:MAG: PD-(D/E)XK nuclease domain-containing protein [Exilibacterium sp.]